jgi:hypothetical protein
MPDADFKEIAAAKSLAIKVGTFEHDFSADEIAKLAKLISCQSAHGIAQLP